MFLRFVANFFPSLVRTEPLAFCEIVILLTMTICLVFIFEFILVNMFKPRSWLSFSYNIKL